MARKALLRDKLDKLKATGWMDTKYMLSMFKFILLLWIMFIQFLTTTRTTTKAWNQQARVRKRVSNNIQ